MSIAPPTITSSHTASIAGTKYFSRNVRVLAVAVGGVAAIGAAAVAAAAGAFGAPLAPGCAVVVAPRPGAAGNGCVGAGCTSSALIPETAATIAAPNSLGCW